MYFEMNFDLTNFFSSSEYPGDAIPLRQVKLANGGAQEHQSR